METYGIFHARTHPSFAPFLADNREELERISALLSGEDITPPPDCALRFFENNAAALRVVILGQDPYPAPGAATGRAFETAKIKSFLDPFSQVSLKNILRAVYCAYTQTDPYSTPFSAVKAAVFRGEFPLCAPGKLFSGWEEQGVGLYNMSLTTLSGRSDAHADLWAEFSERMIKYLGEKNKSIKWFLWGNRARAKLALISASYPPENIYASRHPMMCSEKYDDDFLKNPCFRATRDIIDWRK